jgi:hypothetical protein
MSSSSNHFGEADPLKVQVNFDIPVFEGQIDADASGNLITKSRLYLFCDILYFFILSKCCN